MGTGTIIKGVGGLYSVNTAQGVYLCKPRGIFRLENISPLVGDVVDFELLEEDEGVITHIHQRKTLMNRPKVANVTQAMIVFAVKKPNLNRELLDRLLVSCAHVGVEPIICLNKVDLLKNTDEKEHLTGIYEKAGYQVLRLSAIQGVGLEEIRAAMEGQVTVLAGPSGTGKSSITNAIKGGNAMETGELSKKIQRGKHTTRHTELIEIAPGSFLVDTPGFSSLYFDGIEKEDLKHYFREFKEAEKECRFQDCSHMEEPDCGVKAGVADGSISAGRYQRYRYFYTEIS